MSNDNHNNFNFTRDNFTGNNEELTIVTPNNESITLFEGDSDYKYNSSYLSVNSQDLEKFTGKFYNTEFITDKNSIKLKNKQSETVPKFKFKLVKKKIIVVNDDFADRYEYTLQINDKNYEIILICENTSELCPFSTHRNKRNDYPLKFHYTVETTYIKIYDTNLPDCIFGSTIIKKFTDNKSYQHYQSSQVHIQHDNFNSDNSLLNIVLGDMTLTLNDKNIFTLCYNNTSITFDIGYFINLKDHNHNYERYFFDDNISFDKNRLENNYDNVKLCNLTYWYHDQSYKI